MFRCLSIALAALLPLAAHAAPPTPRLQKGEWAYHAKMTFISGPMAGRSMQRSWQSCVKHDGEPPKLMQARHNGHTQCTAPKLTESSGHYHVTMSCTSQVRDMSNRLDEDFTFTPAADGAKVSMHGTVHQTLKGAPVAIPPTDIRLDVDGHRTGSCGG